jgi:hypothetical protein
MELNLIEITFNIKSKADLLHTMVALWGTGSIAPTHS